MVKLEVLISVLSKNYSLLLYYLISIFIFLIDRALASKDLHFEKYPNELLSPNMLYTFQNKLNNYNNIHLIK